MQKMSFLQLPVLDVAAVGAVVDGLPQQTHPMVQQSTRRERGAIGTLEEKWRKRMDFSVTVMQPPRLQMDDFQFVGRAVLVGDLC